MFPGQIVKSHAGRRRWSHFWPTLSIKPYKPAIIRVVIADTGGRIQAIAGPHLPHPIAKEFVMKKVLKVEGLENRVLLAAGSCSSVATSTIDANGRWTVVGTSGDDTIFLSKWESGGQDYVGIYEGPWDDEDNMCWNSKDDDPNQTLAEDVDEVSVSGLAGDDTIILGNESEGVGGSGSSATYPVTINGNAGHDSIWGSGARDFILGHDGNDRIRGNEEDDYIEGGDGSDYIEGRHGKDVIYGDNTGGGDSTDPDGLNDTIIGDHQNGLADQIFGGPGNDVIEGNGGVDFLDGGDGHDVIDGGSGGDQIYGREGNDVLNGEGGNDSIYGNGGCDVIDGGTSTDEADGGDDYDTQTNVENWTPGDQTSCSSQQAMTGGGGTKVVRYHASPLERGGELLYEANAISLDFLAAYAASHSMNAREVVYNLGLRGANLDKAEKLLSDWIAASTADVTRATD